MNSFFRVLIRIEFILVYLYCLESHLEDHMVFLGLMLGPLAFSPNCSLLLGFQDARHKKNAFSGSRRALESFFHNATVAGIPADGRFINAALRYYGDDITAPLTAWKSDIHPASDQGSPDEPSQSKEHAWCAGASFLSSSCSCDNSRSSSRQMWTTTRIMQPDLPSSVACKELPTPVLATLWPTWLPWYDNLCTIPLNGPRPSMMPRFDGSLWASLARSTRVYQDDAGTSGRWCLGSGISFVGTR
jgi:hypothetical protein